MIPINSVYCGDCLDILPYIDAGSIDAVITDPPYQITACKWDKIIPFEPMWKGLKRVRKERAAVVLFGSEPFSSALRMSNIKEYKYDIEWIKERPSNPALAKKRPLNYRENICIFYEKQPTYNPQMTKRLEKNKRNNANEKFNTEASAKLSNSLKKTGLCSFCYPKNYININVQRGLHPTQKPVLLLEYLIKTYTNPGDLILDFTCGSGTTAVAAINTGRDYICIEKEMKYCVIAEKRIQKAKEGLK